MRYEIEVETFDFGDTCDRACKVVVKAAKAFSAWEQLANASHTTIRQAENDLDALAYECVDCMTACCNMLAALGVTQERLDKAALAVHIGNEESGRYGEA